MERDTESNSPAGANWSLLVDRIRAQDPSAMEELYALFQGGIRYYLIRQVGGQDADDKVHDIFLIIVQAIQRGELREPERLMGFVRTVAHRRVAAHIAEAVHVRRSETPMDINLPVRDTLATPEEVTASQEKIDHMARTLRRMLVRDREVLTRFYLREQTQEQICSEMNLSPTQFRLLKSRAKARFAEKGRAGLFAKSTHGVLARVLSGFRH